MLTEFELLLIVCCKHEQTQFVVNSESQREKLRNQNAVWQCHIVQGWHFLCHIWLLSCHPMTGLSCCHTVESCSSVILVLSWWKCWCKRNSLCEKSWLLLRCLLVAGFFRHRIWKTGKLEITYFGEWILPICEIQTSPGYHSWSLFTPF